MGVPPVKESGVERSPMSDLALGLHGRDAHAPFLMWAGRPRSLKGGGGAIWDDDGRDARSTWGGKTSRGEGDFFSGGG